MILLSILLAAAKQPDTADTPIEINADVMECDQDKGTCIATGNAKAFETKNNVTTTITANQLFADLSSKDHKITKVRAEGTVIFTKEDLTVNADFADYDPESKIANFHADDGKRILITKGKSTIQGDRGSVNMINNKYKVTSKTRTKALIYNEKH